MVIPFLDLSRIEGELKTALIAKFSQQLEEGVFSAGKEVQLLEEQIGKYLKSPYALACANGTDALEIALRALEVGPGDQVIVPAMTWVSTAEAVKIVGAEPVFWDTDNHGVLANDWGKALTSKTKAVIPVHLYGRMLPMEPLAAKAKKHGIYVIEDAAQAFGSFQHGVGAGAFSDVGCLSFYPTKNLGALGEAGMCLTSDSELAAKIRQLRNHGQLVRDQHECIGRNSRIDTIQAGFLNVFLSAFPRLQNRRKAFARLYVEELGGIEELNLPTAVLEEEHNVHLFVIRTSHRNQLKDFLKEKGIQTAIHYPNILPDIPVFAQKGVFPNAKKLSEQGLSLPLNPWMEEHEILSVAKGIQEFFSKFKNGLD